MAWERIVNAVGLLFSPFTFMIIGFFHFTLTDAHKKYDTKVWLLPLFFFLATLYGAMQNKRILFLFDFAAVLYAGYGLKVFVYWLHPSHSLDSSDSQEKQD